MNDEINLTQCLIDIREKVTTVQMTIQHLNARMDDRDLQLGKIEKSVSELERRIDRLEGQKNRDKSELFDYVVKGVVTIFIGYIAVKVGLK